MSEKLTKEQKEIVREIVKQAKELGINPEFAVALANLESSFSHVPASDKESTAFGPFQVNKATAEANGVDYDEMKKDKSLAIKTGLMNLIRHSKNPELMSLNPETGEKEVDPARIIAAHRYGENSDFARTGDPKTIDPTLRSYMRDVAQHFPEQTFPTTVYAPPASTQAEAPAPAASTPTEAAPSQDAKESTGLSWENMPLPLQAPITGAAGAAAGAALGVSHGPLIHGYHLLAGDAEKFRAEQAAAKAAAEAEKQGLTRSDKQMMATGERSDLTGRERQEGYNIETAQRAAQKRQQEQVAQTHGLNPNKVLANAPGLASTPAGIIAPKQAISEWQQSAAMANEMANSSNPTLRERGQLMLQKLKSMGSVTQQSTPYKAARVGFGAGSAIPYAVELARNDQPVAGLGLVPLAGYLANKFPKAFGRATTAGALLGAGYAAAHPLEYAKQMKTSDVVDPTVSMFMTGQELHEPAIAELQDQQRRAGAGRGFVNPPLSRQ